MSPRRFFMHVAVFGIIACASIAAFWDGVLQTPFNIDEAYYLNGSRVFDAWVGLDTRALVQSEEFRLYGAPLSSLLAGASRMLAGAPIEQLYSYPVSDPDPLRVAVMPPPGLLFVARLPAVMMGIASTLLLTALVWRACGAGAGSAVAALLLVDVGFVATNRQLMTEPPLLIFTLLALILALAAARRRAVWAVAGAGVASGLAMASKNTALLAVIASSATVGLTGIRATASRLSGGAKAAAVVAAAALTMVVLNPFSWPDPIGAARDVIATRQSNFVEAVRDYPTQALPTLNERIPMFVWRVFTHGAAFGCARTNPRQVAVDPSSGRWGYGVFKPPKFMAYSPLCQPELPDDVAIRPMTIVNLVLFFSGIVVICGRALNRRRWTMELSILAWLLLFIGVTALAVQLSWGQYYALPTTFSTVIQAVAIGAGVDRFVEAAKRRLL